jgi:hypothetical protein
MKERTRNPIWILNKMHRIEIFSYRPDKLCVTRFFDLAHNVSLISLAVVCVAVSSPHTYKVDAG